MQYQSWHITVEFAVRCASPSFDLLNSYFLKIVCFTVQLIWERVHRLYCNAPRILIGFFPVALARAPFFCISIKTMDFVTRCDWGCCAILLRGNETLESGSYFLAWACEPVWGGPPTSQHCSSACRGWDSDPTRHQSQNVCIIDGWSSNHSLTV